MGKENMLDFKTVHECNRRLDCKTLHPQVSLINLENPSLEQDAVKFEFYAILLIEKCADECSCCGRRYYDYSNATMVFLTPGEIFRMSKEKTLPAKGYLLVFHPDLLFRTTLKNHIGNYTFFHYRKEEALHLSQRETEKVTCCLWHIEEELHHPIDTHSAVILSRHHRTVAGLLLPLLRTPVHHPREQEQDDSGKDGTPAPTIASLPVNCKAGNCLHPTVWRGARPLRTYFCDLLKFETGKTPDEYFRFKRLEAAKRMLLKSDTTPSVVARRLGYPNVQYFSLIFKKITGVAPSDYRCSQN